MKLEQYLKRRRTLRNIKRFNMETVLHPQNLCEHGYGVATIFYTICKELNIGLSSKDLFLIMQHDFIESLTGDLNKVIKEKNKRTKASWDTIEKECCGEELKEYSDEGIKEALKDDDRKYSIFLLSDAMDALLYCEDEIKSGNTHLEIARRHYESKCIELFPIVYGIGKTYYGKIYS